METLLLSNREIAESFSAGKFENAFPYLAEDVVWKIVGDTEIVGKSQVVENCQQANNHGELEQNIFATDQIIKENNKVVIKGSGEFIRDGKRVNLIAACDVYEFNEQSQIIAISSFCIAEKRFARS